MTARRVRFDIRQATKPCLIVLGLWLVVCVAFYMFLVRPGVQEFAELNEGSGPKFEALEEFRERVEIQEIFHTALEQATEDLVLLRKDVLSTRELRYVDAQREVARLCTQFGIDLESVGYSDDLLIGPELDKVVMSVPLEGGYANLRKFLQAVEASDKFLVVERVALDEGKEGGVMLQLNITLATYFDLPEALRRQPEAGGRGTPAGRT